MKNIFIAINSSTQIMKSVYSKLYRLLHIHCNSSLLSSFSILFFHFSSNDYFSSNYERMYIYPDSIYENENTFIHEYIHDTLREYSVIQIITLYGRKACFLKNFFDSYLSFLYFYLFFNKGKYRKFIFKRPLYNLWTLKG